MPPRVDNAAVPSGGAERKGAGLTDAGARPAAGETSGPEAPRPRPAGLPRDRYLSIGKAAEVVGVAQATLDGWAREGRIPALQTPGGRWRFAVEDLAALCDPAARRAREIR